MKRRTDQNKIEPTGVKRRTTGTKKSKEKKQPKHSSVRQKWVAPDKLQNNRQTQ